MSSKVKSNKKNKKPFPRGEDFRLTGVGGLGIVLMYLARVGLFCGFLLSSISAILIGIIAVVFSLWEFRLLFLRDTAWKLKHFIKRGFDLSLLIVCILIVSIGFGVKTSLFFPAMCLFLLPCFGAFIAQLIVLKRNFFELNQKNQFEDASRFEKFLMIFDLLLVPFLEGVCYAVTTVFVSLMIPGLLPVSSSIAVVGGCFSGLLNLSLCKVILDNVIKKQIVLFRFFDALEARKTLNLSDIEYIDDQNLLDSFSVRIVLESIEEKIGGKIDAHAFLEAQRKSSELERKVSNRWFKIMKRLLEHQGSEVPQDVEIKSEANIKQVKNCYLSSCFPALCSLRKNSKESKENFLKKHREAFGYVLDLQERLPFSCNFFSKLQKARDLIPNVVVRNPALRFDIGSSRGGGGCDRFFPSIRME